MARATDTEVKNIINTTIDTTPFIKAANHIVTTKLTGKGLDDSHLKEIEIWLAAHFVCARDPQTQSENVGDASITIQGQFGVGLESTSYGQNVLLLDTSGTLRNLGKKIARLDTVQALGYTRNN